MQKHPPVAKIAIPAYHLAQQIGDYQYKTESEQGTDGWLRAGASELAYRWLRSGYSIQTLGYKHP